MAKIPWSRIARTARAELRKKKARRRSEKPAKVSGVIYVQGEFSPAAEARMSRAGVRIVRRQPNG
jgi:hypothetical protein